MEKGYLQNYIAGQDKDSSHEIQAADDLLLVEDDVRCRRR